MSGAVGSMPSLTRSGRPSARARLKLRRERARGQAVDGVRARAGRLRSAAASGGVRASEANARLSPSVRVRRAPPAPRRRRVRLSDAPERRAQPPMSVTSPDITRASKPRLKRLRFLRSCRRLLLGLVSFVFGMFVVGRLRPAVADDASRSSRTRRARSCSTTSATRSASLSQQNRVIVTPAQIPPIVKEAVISIEDKRFQTNSGVDIRGIARAFVQDILHKGTRPGRLDDRAAVHQERAAGPVAPHDLREAPRGGARLPALAQVVEGKDHHRLPQHDLLRQRRLRDRGGRADLLRPGSQPPRLRHARATNCASQQLQPWEAALLAGIIQSPTEYDPAEHPLAARERRDVVLRQMLDQGYLTRPVYDESVKQALPAPQRDPGAPRSRRSKASTPATSRAGCSSR